MGFQNLSKEKYKEVFRRSLKTRQENKLNPEDKKTLNKTFRFSPSTWEKFEEVCKVNNTKPSKKINEWVKKFIEKGI